MNIENLQILTGTPGEVEQKAEAYFAGNPNARILGTALCVHRRPKAAPEEEEAKPEKTRAKKTAKKAAANAPKDDEKEAEAPEAEAPLAVLAEVEMEEVVTASITVARVWD